VSFVSIEQAREFCRWLTSRRPFDGVFRLPTEDEWLFAAYSADRRYPWGDEVKSHTAQSTAPVRSRPDLRTPDGLYGMWGNVSELVLSPSDGYGGTIKDKYSPFITKWLGESFEASLIRGQPVRPRQDYWGYTHSLKSRSDQWGFRVVFVPEAPQPVLR
jgi:formylglycine-generating enzyme required for sulfatase activity